MKPPVLTLKSSMYAANDLISEAGFSLSELMLLTVRRCWRHYISDPYEKFGYRVFFAGATIDEMRHETADMEGLLAQWAWPRERFKDAITVEEMQRLAGLSVHDVLFLECYCDDFPGPVPKKGRLWVPRASVATLKKLRPFEVKEH